MTFKLTRAKWSLKFCTVSLYLISIGTCLPTAFAQSQASAYETCLLSVNQVSPFYISLWTGAVLFAPKSLENIEIIYLYPMDAVEESDKRNIENWLIGKIDNDRQLVIGKPPYQDNSNWGEHLSYLSESGLSKIVTDSPIPTLSDSNREKMFWTSKLRWKSALDWATSKQNVWGENFPKTDINLHTETTSLQVPDTSFSHYDSDSQRKETNSPSPCLITEAAKVAFGE